MNNFKKDQSKLNNKKKSENSYDPNSMGYESAEVGHLQIDPANYQSVNSQKVEPKDT